ncbi:MAG: peptide ABC transporter permease, partial [Oscillospiraceae bacterium]
MVESMGHNEHKNRGRGLRDTFRHLFMGANNAHLSVLNEEQMQSPFRTIVRNFLENKIAMTGFIVFLFILLSCFILSAVFRLDTSFQDVTQQNIAPGFSMLSVPDDLQNNVKKIDVGSTYSIGIDRAGKVFIWGKTDPKLQEIPTDMGEIAEVSAGLVHVLALSTDNQVYTWGNNRFMLSKIPSEVKRLGKIKQVEAGYQISIVLSEDGRMVSWGNENLVDISLKEYQGKIDKLVSNGVTVLGLTKSG